MSDPRGAQPATGLGDLLASARAQAAAACARSEELQRRTTDVLTKAQSVRRTSEQARRQRRSSPAGQDLIRRSEHARLLARLETMPVIEQAKGILMAQQGCGPDEAFDLLRRASQRANIKVSVLAAHIVEQVASPGSGSGVTHARPERQRDGRRRGSTDSPVGHTRRRIA